MESLYDTLGVSKDASEKEIKSAYRKKVRKAHPDHGGTDDATAKLNAAYAVLSSPERKKNYDENGATDSEDCKNDKVRNLILKEIDECVSNLYEGDILSYVKNVLSEKRNEFKKNLKSLKNVLKYMNNKKGKIKNKNEGINFFDNIIDNHIGRITAQMAMINDLIENLELAIEYLKDYENTDEFFKGNSFNQHVTVTTFGMGRAI